MKRMMTRQWLGAIALFGALAFVAACSGSSPSGMMSPTGPSASSAFSGGATFNPFPDCELEPENPECDPPEEEDPGTGRFTGGGYQFLNGTVKVSRGFTIHCDNRLSNNLEINWPDGNNFHMEKNSQIGTVCTKPFLPNPPNAPVSRIEVTSASGTLNKLPATILFVLEDHGEPGTLDRAYFRISQNGSVVLEVGGTAAAPALIDGGNVQAHFDQPHKNK